MYMLVLLAFVTVLVNSIYGSPVSELNEHSRRILVNAKSAVQGIEEFPSARNEIARHHSASKADFIDAQLDFHGKRPAKCPKQRYPQKDVAVKKFKFGKNWMGRMNQSALFNSFTLPGTHDSGAYELTTQFNTFSPDYVKVKSKLRSLKISQKVMGKLLCKFAIAQSKTIMQQLEGGIRYLDLRIDYDPITEQYRVFHALFGNSAISILRDVRRFLDTNPTEIVVIKMKHFFNTKVSSAIKQDFQNLIIDIFNGVLLPASAMRTDRTLGQMIKSNHRIILVVDDSEIASHELIHPRDIIYSTFADTTNPDTLIEYNNDQLANFHENRSSNQLFKLSWTLTGNAGYMIRHIFSKRGLAHLASIGNPKLDDWVMSNRKVQLGNIFIVDYYQHTNVVPLLVKLNAKN